MQNIYHNIINQANLSRLKNRLYTVEQLKTQESFKKFDFHLKNQIKFSVV